MSDEARELWEVASGMLIDAACRARGVTMEEFYSRSTAANVVSARMAVAGALKRGGLSVKAIAIVMRRSESSVAYYLYPNTRELRRVLNGRQRKSPNLGEGLTA